MTPRVSVVIPTYNQAAFIGRALRSVVAQTMTEWEAIVVNNFSEDDTIAVVEQIADPRIRLINFANHGVIAASRNKAMAEARGEWIAFLDSDDLWYPEKLDKALAATGSGVDLVCHREATVRDGRTLRLSPAFRSEDASYQSLLFRGNCLSPTAVIVRRNNALAVGGFSENQDLITAEDYDFWLKIAREGGKTVFIPDVLSEYTVHEGQNSARIDRHMRAGLAVLDRHFTALNGAGGSRWKGRQRRARALVVYGAGRACQNAGDAAQAIKLLGGALAIYPFIVKAWIAAIQAVMQILTGGGRP